MPHPPSFVERGHGLGARRLASGGVDQLERQRDIDGAQHTGNHLAALVGLGDHAVGIPAACGFGHCARPAFWAGFRDRAIGQHLRDAARVQRADYDAAFVAAVAGGRIDPDHHTAKRIAWAFVPAAFEQRPRPQRALDLLEQHAVEFLPPKRGMAVALADRRDEARWQVGGVLIGRPAADMCQPAGFLAYQPPDQRSGARRGGGHHLGLQSQPQPHRQIVPGRLGLARYPRPFADLVAPGVAVLRAAQAFGLGGRIEKGHRAIGPGQPLERRLVERPVVRRTDCQHPAFAFDHYAARFAKRGGNQRDPCIGIEDGAFAHPFGPGAGLAEAASRANHPAIPSAARWRLCLAPPERPVMPDQRAFALFQLPDQPGLGAVVLFAQPVEETFTQHRWGRPDRSRPPPAPPAAPFRSGAWLRAWH